MGFLYSKSSDEKIIEQHNPDVPVKPEPVSMPTVPICIPCKKETRRFSFFKKRATPPINIPKNQYSWGNPKSSVSSENSLHSCESSDEELDSWNMSPDGSVEIF